MVITAKVRCTSKTEYGDGDARYAQVSFGADYADGRNKEWANATPALSLNMTLNGTASQHFEQGQPYTLEFHPGDDE